MKTLLFIIFLIGTPLLADVDSLTVEAEARFLNADYESAISFYDKIIKVDPKNFNAIHRKALALSYLKKDKEAVKYFTKALELTEDEKDKVYYNRAYSHSVLGERGKSIEDYSYSIKYQPDNPWAYNNRGYEKEKLGTYEEALKDYLKAIELDSTNAFYVYNAGRLFFNVKEYKSAEQFFAHSVKLYPNYPQALMYLGDTYFHLNELEKAKDIFTKIIDLEPKNSMAFLKRAYCWFQLKENANGCYDLKLSEELGNEQAKDFRAKMCN